MRLGLYIVGPLSLAMLFAAGCSNAPGRPTEASISVDPNNISDFAALFSQNCSGCHGKDGKGGAAIPLRDSIYTSVADRDVIRKAISQGVRGTSMPAFAKSAGGMLTDKQIDVLVNGLQVGQGGFESIQLVETSPGDATRGTQVYATFCYSCHGPNGKGTAKASSIVDGSFLALVNDRALRTMIIVGRPDLGAPDFRNNVPGHPMTSQEISDVVAWLSAQRPKFAGQPYPSAQNTQDSSGVNP